MFIFTGSMAACFGYILATLKPITDKFKSSNVNNLT